MRFWNEPNISRAIWVISLNNLWTLAKFWVQLVQGPALFWSLHWKAGCAHFQMCILTSNWLTLTSKMHFVKFHPQVASCFLSRLKRKYAPLGMRLLWKYTRNYFLVYHLTLHFVLYLRKYKEVEAEILDLQTEKYGLSFDIKNVLLPVEPCGMRMWSAYTSLRCANSW